MMAMCVGKTLEIEMSDTPDFEALRSERNRLVTAAHQKFADEEGIPIEALRSNFDPDKCYCACTTGGPCEHKWGGTLYVSEDGCVCSSTCSRCGSTAMHHDMRVMP